MHASSETDSGELLSRWCQVSAGGDLTRFERRLRWAGLTLDAVTRILAVEPCLDDETLSHREKILEQFLSGVQEASQADHSNFTGPHEDVPFVDVFKPLLRVARQLLRDRLERPSELITDGAWVCLERALAERLVEAAGRTLAQEFSHFQPAGHRLLPELLGRSSHLKVETEG